MRYRDPMAFALALCLCSIATIRAEDPGRAGDMVISADLQRQMLEYPSLAESTAGYFTNRDPISQRIAKAQAEAQETFLRVLVVVGDPKSLATQCLVDLGTLENETVRALDDYRRLCVALDDADAVAVLRDDYGVQLDPAAALTAVVLDEQGKVLATESIVAPNRDAELAAGVQKRLDDLQITPEAAARFAEKNGGADLVKILSAGADARVAETLYKAEQAQLRRFAAQYPLPLPDAEELLAQALARAGSEGKRVLMQATGTFCGPCWTLSRYIHAHSDVFEPNYVYLKLDGRFTNAMQVLRRYRPKPGGIPWCAILDADGNMLANWDGPDGKNIGFPSQPASIEYFLSVISKTAPQITEQQIAKLRQDLQTR